MIKVILDPGHGGKDPGAVSPTGLREKDITLKIALYAEECLLKNYMVKVKLTRRNDVFESLGQRAAMANKFMANLFVSIHVNSHINGTGFESFIYSKTPNKTMEFQKILHSELQDFYEKFNLRDRGRKRADFYVLKHTRMPAVLTENLFIQKDGEFLKKESLLKNVGESHARGIARMLNLPKKN